MNRKSEEDGFCSIDGTFLNLRKGNTIIRLLLGYVPVNNVYSEEDGGFMLSCHNEGFSILRKKQHVFFTFDSAQAASDFLLVPFLLL